MEKAIMNIVPLDAMECLEKINRLYGEIKHSNHDRDIEIHKLKAIMDKEIEWLEDE